MHRTFFFIALTAILLPGCTGADAPSQPLPTIEADGTLAIPEGYRPGPKIDVARVDCRQYLKITPVDVRDEARRLCASSTTDAERERNPYCEIQKVTAACERSALMPSK